MTKTCTKCQGQFETEDAAKTMCPACEVVEKPAEQPVETTPTAPAAEAPVTEGSETPAGGDTPQA